MSRYVAIDMSRLPAPDALEPLDHDSLLSARIADLKSRLDQADIPWVVGGLKANPLVIVEEHAAFFDFNLRAEINDAVKAVLLATSWGSNLDHLGAGRQTPRLVAKQADPATNTPAIMEDQERYRRRIQLAPDTWAAEGPLSSYEYFGLDTVPLAQDVAVYDFRHKIGLKRGHILVVVLPFAGDDPETVRNAVHDRLSDRDIAPGGKLVEVVLARLQPVSGMARLLVGRGPDREIVKARALEELRLLFERARGFHPVFSHSQLTKALQVDGARSVVGVTPDADIDLDHRTVAVQGTFDLKVDVA